jgi:hypothetical protein
MSPIEKELIETIRNSANPELVLEYALDLIFELLQTPLPFAKTALVVPQAAT